MLVIERIRAQLAGNARQLDAAEILLRQRKVVDITNDYDQSISAKENTEAQVILRLLSRSKYVVCQASSFESEATAKLVSEALVALEKAPDNPHIKIQPISFDSNPSVDFSDETFSFIPLTEKINRLKNLEEKIQKGETPKAGLKLKSQYLEESRQEAFWTLGSHRPLVSKRTLGSIAVEVKIEKGGVESIGEDSVIDTTYYSLDWDRVAREATSRAERMAGAQNCVPGVYQLLFTNHVTPELVSALGQWLRGDRILSAGADSFWAQKKKGEMVVSPLVSIVDDPFLKKTVGQAYWDSEGVPTKRLELIKDGKLNSFAHNLASGAQMNEFSTGNAFRKWGEASPEVGYHNLCLEPGNKDFVDLLRATSRGLAVYRVKELESARAHEGYIRLCLSGSRIENGTEQYPFKDALIEVQVADLFNNITLMGRDLRLGRRVAAPSFLCSEYEVGALS